MFTTAPLPPVEDGDHDSSELITSPINQTRFGSEEPLFEGNGLTPVPGALATSQTPFIVKHKVPVIIAVLMGSLLLFIVAIVALTSMSRQILGPNGPLQPLATPAVSTDPMQAEIKAIRDQLYTSDPTKQEWPFPPVNMTITLEDKK